MTTRIPFPSRPKGSRHLTDGLLCEACWRPIRRPENAYTVVADTGIGHLVPLPPEEPNGGAFAIGPECAREIPAGYKVKGWQV